MRWIKPTVFLTLLGALAVYFYDALQSDNISVKANHDFRIGYINLNASIISQADLDKITSYNCDLWLFLEWNGNNIEGKSNFLKKYFQIYEIENERTFGLSVFSKISDVGVITKLDSTLVCPYPINQIKYDGSLNIYLAHAPPPVPTCHMQTNQYLDSLISFIKTNERATIVIGDLNTLPFQSPLRYFKKGGYLNPFETLKELPQATFSVFTWMPNFLKIDYIFYKGRLRPTQAKRFALRSSDHSGFICDFSRY